MKSSSPPSTLVSLLESPSQPEPQQPQQKQQQKPDTAAAVRPLRSSWANGSSSTLSSLLHVKSRATGWLLIMAAVMALHQHVFLQPYTAVTTPKTTRTAAAGVRSRRDKPDAVAAVAAASEPLDLPTRQKDDVPPPQPTAVAPAVAPAVVPAVVVKMGSTDLLLPQSRAARENAVLDPGPNGTSSRDESHDDTDTTKLNDTTSSPLSVVDNATTPVLSEQEVAMAKAALYWPRLDLPRPQQETKPWAAICAMMKDEERLDRDAKMGTHPRVHVRHRVVTDHFHQQHKIDPECLDHLRTLPHPPKWVMVHDADEYLVFGDMDRHPNVVSFLTEYLTEGSLQLNWVLMGSSYELHYRDEPVTKRFQRSVYLRKFDRTKAVAVLDHVKGWFVHCALHKDGYSAKGLGKDAKVVSRAGIPYPWHVDNGDRSIAALYHFKYKSYDEFNYKECVRGRVDDLKERCPTPGETGDTFDDRAWRAMQRLVPRYANYSSSKAINLTGSVQQTKKQPSSSQILLPTSTTTALCAIVTDGDDRYLREWTDYHLALGFEHIYIFDVHRRYPVSAAQSSWYDPQWGDMTQASSRVRLYQRILPTRRGVVGDEVLYRECMQELRYLAHPPHYVMALDVNDFLVVRDLDRYPNVTTFLADHLQSGSLQISRVIMGSSNESNYQAAVPVTRRFQTALADGLARFPQAKPVAVLNHIEGLKTHSAIHNPGCDAIAMGGQTANIKGDPCCVQDGNVSVAAIYHYRYKSTEEYRDRQCQGRGDARRNPSAKMPPCDAEKVDNSVEAGTIPDSSAWQALTRLVPKYSRQSASGESATA